MDFNEYQKKAITTNQYPYPSQPTALFLGLAEEAGEVAGKLKKHLRGDAPLDIDGVMKELGDVLWYMANLAYYYGFYLQTVAEINLEKLESRAERNQIKGNGDDR